MSLFEGVSLSVAMQGKFVVFLILSIKTQSDGISLPSKSIRISRISAPAVARSFIDAYRDIRRLLQQRVVFPKNYGTDFYVFHTYKMICGTRNLKCLLLNPQHFFCPAIKVPYEAVWDSSGQTAVCPHLRTLHA